MVFAEPLFQRKLTLSGQLRANSGWILKTECVIETNPGNKRGREDLYFSKITSLPVKSLSSKQRVSCRVPSLLKHLPLASQKKERYRVSQKKKFSFFSKEKKIKFRFSGHKLFGCECPTKQNCGCFVCCATRMEIRLIVVAWTSEVLMMRRFRRGRKESKITFFCRKWSND